MAMNKFQLLIALVMLITGTLNTLTNSYTDMLYARGTEAPSTIWGKLNGETERNHLFDHPFLQAVFMFIGEATCFFVYLATRERRQVAAPAVMDGGNGVLTPPRPRSNGALWFVFPAMCDMCCTGSMYAGLCLSYASTYQMLRGSVVFFTAIMSHFVLGRKQWAYQWFSVFVVIVGVTAVGFVSLVQDKPDKGKTFNSVLIGDILILGAQFVASVMMVTEEKIMSVYHTPAFLAVGMEGFFGLTILGSLCAAFFFIRIDGYPLENAPDGLAQLWENKMILLMVIGNMVSIAFFNVTGITITKELSCAHRMILDSMRTLLVWAASLGFGWEKFHPLQLVGFILMTIGTATYNEIIPLPFFSRPPPVAPEDSLSLKPDVSSVATPSTVDTPTTRSLLAEAS